MSRVFLASRNAKKLGRDAADPRRARRRASRCVGLDDVADYDEPVEDQPTFEGNALLKARAGCAATGLPTIADDSGLCVDALNGMPGVLSARWSGPAQERRAQQRAAARPARRRTRRAARRLLRVRRRLRATPDGGELVEHGRMPGRIIREPRGSGGFGYDVLFVADEHAEADLTSAELDPAEKDRISHRGHALRALAPRVAGCADLIRRRPDSPGRVDPAGDEHPPQRGEDEHHDRVDRGRDRDLDVVEDLDRDEDRQRPVVHADLERRGDRLGLDDRRRPSGRRSRPRGWWRRRARPAAPTSAR